jgi:hypothetical protein
VILASSRYLEGKKIRIKESLVLSIFENFQNKKKTTRFNYLKKKFRFKEPLVLGISKTSRNLWVS